MADVQKGSRKLTDARETMVALLIGFTVAAYFRVDVQLYFAFAAGVVGKSGVFNWGNAKEHEAAKEVKNG